MYHWAWLGAEYHARKHETTGRVPRDHFLSEVEYLRTLPRRKNLDEVFLHRESRKVRNDGTVRFRGAYLEVQPELMGSSSPGRLPSPGSHGTGLVDLTSGSSGRSGSRRLNARISDAGLSARSYPRTNSIWSWATTRRRG